MVVPDEYSLGLSVILGVPSKIAETMAARNARPRGVIRDNPSAGLFRGAQ